MRMHTSWPCLRFWEVWRVGGWFRASTRLEARGLGGLKNTWIPSDFSMNDLSIRHEFWLEPLIRMDRLWIMGIRVILNRFLRDSRDSDRDSYRDSK